MRLIEYLGRHVSNLLETAPFKDWPFEKSFEDDLEERIIHYVFKAHGFELRCDQNEKISVIFLSAEGCNSSDENLFEIPFSWSRKKALEHFGPPSKNGEKISDPILGNYGAWDRFTHPEYAVHVEYESESDRIKRITLMRGDVIP